METIEMKMNTALFYFEIFFEYIFIFVTIYTFKKFL